MTRSPTWRFAVRWTALTALGAAAGVAAMFAGLGAALRTAPPPAFGAALGGVVGGGCALGQWVALRRVVRRAAWWVPATAAAWIAFWALNLAGAFGRGAGVGGKVLEGLGHGALFGALLGVAQSWVLRATAPRAERWVVASAVAWALGAASGDGLKALTGGTGPVDVVGGVLVSAALSGAALGALLRARGAGGVVR